VEESVAAASAGFGSASSVVKDIESYDATTWLSAFQFSAGDGVGPESAEKKNSGS
jgi:hypothetical protein